MASENKDNGLTTKITDLITLQSFLKERDNSQNSQYISPVPDVCKEYPCILGIDEAGRGPVLGPMVYGAAFVPINDQMLLENLECADSKELTEEKRDRIFENICKNSQKMGWTVDVISPNYICNSMFGRSKHSLNQVSMDSAIGLIKAALAAKVKLAHVFVDTVGKPEKYQDYLKSLFPELEITVAKKADSLYPIVSAASICAKVTRDHALKVWQFVENIDVEEFGSGYPGDPVTKRFLRHHYDMVFGYPQLVRFSWSTAEKALEELAYHVEWEEEDIPKKAPPKTTSVASFFKVVNSEKDDEEKKPKKMHEFFTQRCLSRDVEFYIRTTLFPELEVTVAKKADSLYPIVSAASICAKVTRNHALKVWQFVENVDVEEFGSGYPGDPVTKRFLRHHYDMVFGYPQLVRFSWSTAEKALEELAYHVEWKEEEIPKKALPKTTSVASFFKVVNSEKDGEEQKPKKMHEFFTQRCLSRDVEF